MNYAIFNLFNNLLGFNNQDTRNNSPAGETKNIQLFFGYCFLVIGHYNF